MNKTKIILLIMMSISLLCVGCIGENTAGLQSKSVSVSEKNTDAGISDSVAPEKTDAPGEEESVYELEIKYGFTLPKVESFRAELEKLIYWTYATVPTKESENIYSYLKENKVLGKSLEVKLSYVKSAINEFGETDKKGRPHYRIYISFPELQEKEEYIWLCSYNAKGICDVYEFDPEESYSEKELQEEECGEYIDWGKTTICIDEEKAEQFVPEEDTSGIRKKIETDCLKEIKDYCGTGECEIYLYDFLPGEEWIHGQLLICDPEGGRIPVDNLSVQVCYEGDKMEDYSEILWYQRAGGSGNSGITSEDAREMLEQHKEEMLPEHCFMAYHVKGKEMISLKQK